MRAVSNETTQKTTPEQQKSARLKIQQLFFFEKTGSKSKTTTINSNCQLYSSKSQYQPVIKSRGVLSPIKLNNKTKTTKNLNKTH